MASKLGDPTARFLGRLTLNPLAHLDPIGTLALLFSPVGWAKPVPVNALNFRHPRKDMAWVAVAGPLTNLFVAALTALAMRLAGGVAIAPGVWWLASPLFRLLQVSFAINVFLALFNMLPIPPLDGGRIVTGILPSRKALAFSRIEPYGFIILIVLILTGVVNKLIVPGFLLVHYLLLGA